MAIENDDDRAIFFSPDDFGAVATITLNDSTVLTVSGIYEDPHITKGLKQDNQFSYQGGQDVSGSKPEFRARASDLVGVKGGRATVSLPAGTPGLPDGGEFNVHDVKPDGTGLTCLRLMRA